MHAIPKAKRKILISNCSAPLATKAMNDDTVQIFPQGFYIPRLNNTHEDHQLFARQFLMAAEERRAVEKIEALVATKARVYKRSKKASEESKERTKKSIHYLISDVPTILICSHNTRDRRCGILGPLLNEAFEKYGTSRLHRNLNYLRENKAWDIDPAYRGIRVTSISHIGGHIWAGNVIVYIPSMYHMADGRKSPLAGRCVWYGRVEPKHVEGIVEETIKKGRIIEELLRGVHSRAQHYRDE